MKRGSSGSETRDKRTIEDLIDTLEYLLSGDPQAQARLRKTYRNCRAALYRQIERIQRRRGA